jgi:hypothetical protein
MTRKQLIRAAIALAAAILLWAVLAIAHRPGSERGASLALPKIDTASVDSIALIGPRDTIRLARTGQGQWRVNGFPAAPTAVSDLLQALRDTTAWSELVAQRATSHPRLGVTADSGRRLRVASHGRTLLDLVTGKQTSDYTGLYVRRSGEDAVYALHGNLTNALRHGVDDWRDRRIAAVPPESVATVEVQRGARSYALRRTGSGWRFASGGPADSAAVASLLNEYRELTASGFATPAQADSAHFDRSRRRARLLAAGDRPLLDLRFDSTASGVWARADSGGTVFRIDSWTLNHLIPADSTLRPKPKTK